jgi:hypothetical protein
MSIQPVIVAATDGRRRPAYRQTDRDTVACSTAPRRYPGENFKFASQLPVLPRQGAVVRRSDEANVNAVRCCPASLGSMGK